MSRVRIPPTLRAATAGTKLVDIDGVTVQEVVDNLIATYPRLAGQLLGPDGQVNRFINVFLNDTDVRHLDGLATSVGERDGIVLLPAMAGG
jgi:molybdopterin converting factor small subunit